MTLGVRKVQGEFDFGPEFLDNDQVALRGRLRILHEDPRAGFLPTTHEEKNQALTLLSYIDEPQYPAGIGHQLREVFERQKGLAITAAKERTGEEHLSNEAWVIASGEGVNQGRRALISITNEFGDYTKDALNQTSLLEDLKTRIDDCPNPAVTIADEVGVEHKGIAALLRYKDLSDIRDHGKVEDMPIDPFKTHENRSKQKDPAKNKTLHDAYTGEEPDPIIAERIVEFAYLTSIKDARLLIEAAYADQQRRLAFWIARLQETRSHGAAWLAGRKILENLGLPLR